MTDRQITPGRLAKWGLLILGLGLVVSFVITATTTSRLGLVLWFFTVGVAVLLLLGAGVAKVVQIGVRSAGDDR